MYIDMEEGVKFVVVDEGMSHGDTLWFHWMVVSVIVLRDVLWGLED
jgi:hypothetical protein